MTPDTVSTDRSSRGVYGISVTSELSGVGLQTLRLYERRGLISPDRTVGGTRRYSPNDLRRLERIRELVGLGVNLTGIARILELEDTRARLIEENALLANSAAQLEFSR
ncbi:DNA-binding transcriptional MerR regulator [Rhodococcus sp. AG1013]|uniref:MerR family transcriptional regulator n=1 Tax=Rhodococcus sp. AG1013 TaxID=2183996 RepID=UPI000E0B4D87|nr:MerR family transcriptional regulator [Rhodococcus sp. AG1013]RDI30451.1 DNA-binding transcriptional MerR regulator [Rhodococcus sp. AG1013]